ncbi:uncharacterized protein LOC133336820 [Musca vetustissima]|uniref:uncharacterized protein LOC133336820 n=1 Tax=Musca vetustissima TaxID=27455 RepID=UPI002AB6ADE5|nr:uncharacterized protein LOC133336820 [Musca vetustissima]
MATTWDQPLSSSESEHEATEDEGQTFEEHRYNENINKLKSYVDQMSYVPVKTPKASPYTEMLAKPKKTDVVHTAEEFANVVEPPERGERLRYLASKFQTITTDDLEKVIRQNKIKDLQKEDIAKRKQEIYYAMLTKLERQSRLQYLNVVVKKFADFIAKLATTMRIPPTLVDPYARMQRGIFCNILLAIGVQPNSQAAIYYNTPEGNDYEVYHRLSHAILSLIIKALDSASTRRSTDDSHPIKVDFDMDNYIRERLMCAAEKKIQAKMTTNEKGGNEKFAKLKKFDKCQDVSYRSLCIGMSDSEVKSKKGLVYKCNACSKKDTPSCSDAVSTGDNDVISHVTEVVNDMATALKSKIEQQMQAYVVDFQSVVDGVVASFRQEFLDGLRKVTDDVKKCEDKIGSISTSLDDIKGEMAIYSNLDYGKDNYSTFTL